jgi:hypothetical protein
MCVLGQMLCSLRKILFLKTPTLTSLLEHHGWVYRITLKIEPGIIWRGRNPKVMRLHVTMLRMRRRQLYGSVPKQLRAALRHIGFVWSRSGGVASGTGSRRMCCAMCGIVKGKILDMTSGCLNHGRLRCVEGKLCTSLSGKPTNQLIVRVRWRRCRWHRREIVRYIGRNRPSA